MPYLHEREDFKTLIDITARDEKIDDPSLVEKDYWIMHCLFELKRIGLKFELKGGTSLSKGFGVIDRFSEDLDVHIEPDTKLVGFQVFAGKNHDKPSQIESRKKYFDWLATYLKKHIPALVDVVRDEEFDDPSGRYRNGGVLLKYKTSYPLPPGIKDGILLEVGFDRTAPNEPRTISSWIFKKARTSNEKFDNNEAQTVPCYLTHYTFVEKLQAVVRKYRLYKESGSKKLPANFLRHYYDLFKLIDLAQVQKFIGTTEYEAFKKERFRGDDTKVSNSGAFNLQGPDLALFEKKYAATSSLYYRGQPPFARILERLNKDLLRL